ncbi:hypothetical protein XFF7766_280061 [Xanthomonas citri pv. fuscans]|nr:hypothetical protein XFF7766_280061 [Xanthomonas citri pv. fuscans]
MTMWIMPAPAPAEHARRTPDAARLPQAVAWISRAGSKGRAPALWPSWVLKRWDDTTCHLGMYGKVRGLRYRLRTHLHKPPRYCAQ